MKLPFVSPDTAGNCLGCAVVGLIFVFGTAIAVLPWVLGLFGIHWIVKHW